MAAMECLFSMCYVPNLHVIVCFCDDVRTHIL